MNKNVIHNTAYNYLSGYHISIEHLQEMEKSVVESSKTKFYLYKRLCDVALNSQVAEEKCSFFVEIYAKENRNLVDDIQRNFLRRLIKRTGPDKKKGHHTEVGNLFLKIKVFKWIIFRKLIFVKKI